MKISSYNYDFTKNNVYWLINLIVVYINCKLHIINYLRQETLRTSVEPLNSNSNLQMIWINYKNTNYVNLLKLDKMMHLMLCYLLFQLLKFIVHLIKYYFNDFNCQLDRKTLKFLINIIYNFFNHMMMNQLYY